MSHRIPVAQVHKTLNIDTGGDAFSDGKEKTGMGDCVEARV